MTDSVVDAMSWSTANQHNLVQELDRIRVLLEQFVARGITQG